MVELLGPHVAGEAAACSGMWLVMIAPIAAGLVAFLLMRRRLEAVAPG